MSMSIQDIAREWYFKKFPMPNGLRERQDIANLAAFHQHMLSLAPKQEETVAKELTEETRVELVPNNYDCMLTCTKCHDGVPYYLMEEFDDYINYCPSCGRKINKANHGSSHKDAPNPPERQGGARLSEEEIERIAMKWSSAITIPTGKIITLEELRAVSEVAVIEALCYARDKGYLAPKQEVGVDQLMEVVRRHFDVSGGPHTFEARLRDARSRLSKLLGK